MAKYRPIYIQIWKDPDFQELSPTDKLLFIYLCTNSATSESGIYSITAKTISSETTVKLSTVKQRLHNGLFKNILYDEERKVVFIKRFRKYNLGGKPDLIRRSIVQDCFCTPLSPLWAVFVKEYPQFETDITTVVKGFNNGKLTDQYSTLTLNLNNNVKSLNNTSSKTKVTKGGTQSTPSLFLKDIASVFSGLKTRRGYTSHQSGAEAKAIKDMLREEFKPDDILRAYDLVKAQPFFTDKNLSMMQVRNNIHEVLKNAQPERPKQKRRTPIAIFREHE